MGWINRQLPIIEVARALELWVEGDTAIHCFRSERHDNGDRTASLMVWPEQNKVKCFGNACGLGPLGPVDLVIEVRGVNAAVAAEWIAKGRKFYDVGKELPIEAMIRSGIFAKLSYPARAIVPTLLGLADKVAGKVEGARVTVSYKGLSRYSGVSSQRAVRDGLKQLVEIGWIEREEQPRDGPLRPTAIYKMTPRSDRFLDLVAATDAETRKAIEIEKEIRDRARQDRRAKLRDR